MIQELGPKNVAARTPIQAPGPDAAGLKLGTFLLSQSGAVMPDGYGSKKPTAIVPPGSFERMEVMALDPAGVHRTAKFDIDDNGVPRPSANQPPLGHVPYQVTLIDKDGNRFSGKVDITPGKTGVSHQGYETIKGLALTKEPPAKAPPAGELTMGAFMISQSGGLMPEGYGDKGAIAAFPPGFAASVEVMALDPGRVHRKARFDVDDRGVIKPDAGQPPLGHVPYRITVTDHDGNKYAADVDVSPKKTGKSHQGWDTLKDLKLRLVAPDADAANAAVVGVAGDFAKQQAQPKTGQRAFDLMLKR